jgi:hypothetical protein
MNEPIHTLRKLRGFVLSITDDLTPDELNRIPAGFSNNIIWNLGHLVAAQEGVCYRRNGLDTHVDEAFFDAYKPGSKPEAPAGVDEIANIRGMLLTSLDMLEEDVQNGRFETCQPWTTRYGVELKSIEDALNFLSYHEGLHAGYVMAMKRMVLLTSVPV